MDNKQIGIENIKEAVVFVIKLSDAFFASFEDGKLGAMDAFNFLGAFQASFAAFSDVDQIKYELANLSDAEKADLKAYVEQSIDYDVGSVEVILENSLMAVIAIGQVISQYLQKKA